MNLKQIFGRRKEDADLAEELQAHLQHEIDDNIARGMSPDEARRRAHVNLGNPTVIRDRVFEANRLAWIEDIWRDLRYAARTLRKSPSFTFVALLVMALGIGANTAIYSFLDSLLLRSLPVSDPRSLVTINWHAKTTDGDFVMHGMSGDVNDDPKLGSVSDIFPYPAFELLKKNDVFSDVFAYCHTREVRQVSMALSDEATIATGESVSGNYFRGLGVMPFAGRLLVPDDDRIGAAHVVVLSHAYSEKHFGNAAAAAGQAIRINNVPFTVAGVAPPEFFGVDPEMVPDFYVPMHSNIALGANDTFGFQPSDYLDGNYYWLEMMARLRPGVTLEQAQAALAPQFAQWVATTATKDLERSNLPMLHLKRGGEGLDTLRRHFSKPFFLLMTLVALILAIACSNVANLLLVRAASRRREIALRIAEGASRWRVVRQLLTESVLLSAAGGALGIVVALGSIRFLTMLMTSAAYEDSLRADLNWRVMGLTTLLALLTGLIFGLVPALQATRVDLVSALKEVRGSQRPRHRRFRLLPVNLSQTLVVGQIAISLLILVAAGLFVHTLSNLQSMNMGFNRENLLLFKLNATQSGHKNPEIADFYGRLRRRFSEIPGVQSAGLANGSLIGGEDQMPITVPGGTPNRATRYLTVGPQFLTTMQVPILLGRDIEERDRADSPKVAIVNEQFVKMTFAGQNPVGRQLTILSFNKPIHDMEIVGVARNAHYGDLRSETPPVVYIPYNQGKPEPNEMTYVLRTMGDPLSYLNAVRDIVHQADPGLPVAYPRTQKADISANMAEETVLAELCSAFAILALAIASVGLYGTISYTVAHRTGEIGIRMALGAERGPVLWMVLRQVLVLAGLGLAISLPIALGTSKFVASFLYGMKPNDPAAIALAVVILVIAALLAGGIPARRASQIDPMTALRHE